MIDYKVMITTPGIQQQSPIARMQNALANLQVTVELLFDCSTTEDESILVMIDESCVQKLEQIEQDLLDLWATIHRI